MGIYIRFAMWAFMMLGGLAAGILIDLKNFRFLFLNIYFHIFTLVPGLVLLRMVMLVSRKTGRMLARYGREGEVKRMETNRLVTSGVYSCMRHPMHFGLLFFPLSLALIAGSPSFIVIIAPVEMILMVVMIKLLEEREAIEKFGEDYIRYMKEVPMFNLRPECLKRLFEG